jgi:hypothetical protein
MFLELCKVITRNMAEIKYQTKSYKHLSLQEIRFVNNTVEDFNKVRLVLKNMPRPINLYQLYRT